MVLDLDLNDPPPVENVFLNPISVSPNLVQASEVGLSEIQATTDSEHVDDEVVICSPRSFAEARDKSRRNRGVQMVDEVTGYDRFHAALLSPSGFCHITVPKKRRTANGNICINLECQEEIKSEDFANPHELPPSVPQPKVASFKCPVCMGPFVEETSTKCGHIFCKKCIKTAIATQSKCPSCRRKLKVKDTFRVYLPASD